MLNKATFIETISTIGGITKKEAGNVLELVLAATQKACKEDGGVNLVGVGKVEVKNVSAKVYKNPKTGEEVPKEATQTIKVKVSKSFVEQTLEV